MTRNLKRRLIMLFSLLAGLGVGGCTYTAMYGPVAMYGPAPAYGVALVARVRGTVKTAAGTPVAGVLVVVKNTQTYKEAVSGTDGSYVVALEQFTDKDTAYVTAVDIDGPEHGALATGDATVTFDITKPLDYTVDFALPEKDTP